MISSAGIIRKEISPYLSPGIKERLLALKEDYYTNLEEIRLRAGKPLLLRIGDKDYGLDYRGNMTLNLNDTYRVSEEDVFRTLASISDNSLYAFEEDIKKGFITIPGGHRVGLAGQVVMQGSEIKAMRDFSGICFRIAREIKDCARPLLSYICRGPGGAAENTLIISPPRCGKTTVLRDIARALSTGSKYCLAHNVVVVDERSEIAGCFRGIAQLDVGPRTDVLDSCPKALGIMMAIRSLSPQVIITDEIGRSEDVKAIHECMNAGVTIISTIHAGDLDEVKNRALFQDLPAAAVFKNAVILSRRNGPGTVEDIVRWG
ncbi:MAG: stage III sporulation protein AA [Syntrophomonas sp.]